MSSQQNNRIPYMLHYICGFVLLTSSESFTLQRWNYMYYAPTTPPTVQNRQSTAPGLFMIYAPPGSGYHRPEDEESMLPSTYDPMMEYPGTMRPGTTPENMPFSDLPIADSDPDPVPWPHFQQIEWHHKWDPPHEAALEMEEFIEQQGRWATPEMEAAMRAGVRQGIRDRQEKEAAEKKRDSWVITDDDDEDDPPNTDNIELGDGMYGSIGSAVVDAMTAEAVRPKAESEEEQESTEVEEDTGSSSMDDDLDSFLLDLGLDADVEMEDDTDSSGSKSVAADDDAEEEDAGTTLDLLSDDGDVTATINVDADDDLDLGLDDDDDLDGDDGVEVPLDAFGDDNDTLNGEDIFDEGGFDFDDGDFDAGDVW
ncbi:expressed unknown protein [Seminavis robusta]|uniref:Uncharacterized protein n=1 Tax=Seminavis robusta TaxID=568900 RepID=A0A9N8HXX5_9STRA|nr:expressed unknown protein [Seminavis robusta]|eukprot:Sro3426_g347900.1 n/a (368) ;mRNA; r:1887-2990